jgi:hypothetical protein
MHDIDTLSRDESLEDSPAAAELERIESLGFELEELSAESHQVAAERAALSGHDGARARATQGRRDAERATRDRVVAQGRDDLQHGCAGQPARGLAGAFSHGGDAAGAPRERPLAFGSGLRNTASIGAGTVKRGARL